MKKVLLGLAALLLSVSAITAQGSAELKAAAKAYDAFALDNSNKAKLQEAVTNIAVALEGAETKGELTTHMEAGDIYAAVMNQIVIIKTSEGSGLFGTLEDLPQVDNPAIKAATAYMTAYNMAEKKGKKRQAIAALGAIQGNLSNAGIFAIQAKDYANSYLNFVKSVEVHDFLKAQGLESFLDAENKYSDEKYYAAISALLTENYAAAKPLYLELKDAGYPDPGIYDGLYKVSVAMEDKETALAYLNEGREKHPEDTQLLFTEINYYLGEKKLDVLIDKLKAAIDKEPDNVSLYATMGSVFDNLYQNASAAGEEDKAKEYFDNAKSYYEQALEKKPDYASAVYSIGALYFNRGAAMTQQLVELESDLSKEGQAKYEAMQKQVAEEFDLALPYFKQAEQMDPNDVNILIALREIFARKSEFDLSNEFKDRYEKIQSGETLDSYFKSN